MLLLGVGGRVVSQRLGLGRQPKKRTGPNWRAGLQVMIRCPNWPWKTRGRAAGEHLRPDRLRDPKPALTRRAERPGSTAQPYGRGSGHQASKKNSRRSPQLGLLHLNLPSWAKHGPGLGPEPHLTRRPELAAARRCLCATHGRTPSREPLISAFALGVSYPSRGPAAVASQSTQHTAGPLQSSGLLHRCESYLGGVLFCSTPKPPLYPPGGAFEMRVHQVPVKMLREITDA